MLLIIHSSEFHQMIPDGRVRPVGADHEVERDLNLRVPLVTLQLPRRVLLLEPGQIACEVRSGKLVIEMKGDI